MHGSDSYEAAGREIEMLFPTITGNVDLTITGTYCLLCCHSMYVCFSLLISSQETPMESTLETGSRRLSRRLAKNRRPTWQGGSQQFFSSFSVLVVLGFNIMARCRESIVGVYFVFLVPMNFCSFRYVVPTLQQGLTVMYRTKPDEPLLWLINFLYLFHYRV